MRFSGCIRIRQSELLTFWDGPHLVWGVCFSQGLSCLLRWTAFQVAIVVKNQPANAGDSGDVGSIPGLGTSPRHGSALQYSFLENPMDRGAWQGTVHRVAKSWTWLKGLSIRTLSTYRMCICLNKFTAYLLLSLSEFFLWWDLKNLSFVILFILCMGFGRTDAEAETPILQSPDAKSWLIWKDPDAGKDWTWEEKGTTEDEMVGWHHQFNGHEFE